MPTIPERRVRLHQKIADDLHRRIRSGRLPSGMRLPTQRWLAAHYGASAVTLQRAIDLLVNAGVVRKDGMRGAVVNGPGAAGARGVDVIALTDPASGSTVAWLPSVGISVLTISMYASISDGSPHRATPRPFVPPTAKSGSVLVAAPPVPCRA